MVLTLLIHLFHHREERCGYLDHYKAILKDYQEKYASFKHSRLLLEKKVAAEELEKKLQAALAKKLQLQHLCEQEKGRKKQIYGINFQS